MLTLLVLLVAFGCTKVMMLGIRNEVRSNATWQD